MFLEVETQNDVCIVRLKGPSAMAVEADYLQAKKNEIKSLNCRKVLVDLSEVSWIGSTVIGFCVELYTSTLKNPGGRFTLAGANPRVREVLDITRLSTVIPLAPDTASGLAALGEGQTARAVNLSAS